MNIELLAPAGNLEKLRMAVIYGADAVYLAGPRYGLRAGAGNFTFDEMKEGIRFAHERNRKVYVTMNILPHNEDFDGMEEYVARISDIGADAVIVSDLGVLSVVKEVNPAIPVHISTQANVTNYRSAMKYKELGASRIIAARELSLAELALIHQKVPDIELEAFVHGSMCISYSGRCLLSSFMCGRDANRGDCAQSCRWKYYLMEEKRPGEYFPVVEDERGTFILNSKDLCMIEHIPELVKAGITSFKIEGRMKSSFYVSTVVRAYRMALDAYLSDPGNYAFRQEWLEEVSKVSHRSFTTGFFFNKPGHESQNYGTSSYIQTHEFAGIVLEYNEREKTVLIEQRNRIFAGDEIEIMQPDGKDIRFRINDMWDMEGNAINSTPHPQMKYFAKVPEPVMPNSILRKKIG
ncbi:peptidase U32 [Thermoclostridium stercorarium subsp. stercorarium DSM 8532]|jgi:putative protease|uniref:Peptidase U32 n=3 Tax=Thermoclostridium stercorarium TaxID=1510 RepID=L7VP79_THES1|nr:U32 family peptidase [Thermoclostridium stercorarium]AGC68484.1 peptidase U32 [Thermoclostridium stercorarium subsp. stercorarium DSM 8532]AGI39502.1 collagenase [Thermoclostridium stercorarium subsp. stercorarium DSM 8532]ANW98846.1 peptidase U32 [Thermoclostridium stercorarium subsp. thermolacticum DSM 2910]ANX01371.1 peptidase U32 [Thermoclostridium stercorarium subsp. leptospartum DSM 9219]UZQ84470.1 U32 family peptidase [Thermoclostridium stercorarium]